MSHSENDHEKMKINDREPHENKKRKKVFPERERKMCFSMTSKIYQRMKKR